MAADEQDNGDRETLERAAQDARDRDIGSLLETDGLPVIIAKKHHYVAYDVPMEFWLKFTSGAARVRDIDFIAEALRVSVDELIANGIGFRETKLLAKVIMDHFLSSEPEAFDAILKRPEVIRAMYVAEARPASIGRERSRSSSAPIPPTTSDAPSG